MTVEKSSLFVGPGEGAHLPILDVVHKVSAKYSGGSLVIEEWSLPPGAMIPPTPTPAKTSARSCWRAS